MEEFAHRYVRHMCNHLETYSEQVANSEPKTLTSDHIEVWLTSKGSVNPLAGDTEGFRSKSWTIVIAPSLYAGSKCWKNAHWYS